MKTLYVSDLDGTLLRSSERTSDFTNRTINELVEQGVLFSYATARSYVTAHKVTQGLHARIPVIIYNGAFIRDHVSGEILLSSYFGDGAEAEALLKELLDADVYPLVYATFSGDSRASIEDGQSERNHHGEDERGQEGDFYEKFSYIPQRATEGMRRFLDTRKGDERERAVSTVEELMDGDIFYFTCIDEREKLAAICERYRERYHCVLSQEIYTKDWFLEIMPLATSKARAVMRLKEYLGCDRVVAFGDHYNDIDMFEVADEAYAVENAVEELKAAATGVIASNDDDGVAHFLRERLSEFLGKA
ncbi:MAG: HAD family hydrolase [Lachnospiraceae bacterium]|nr:HAD family hydrolase [Lachnospiraceae bacterium]